MSDRYEIRTVADFAALSAEQRARCLVDLMRWSVACDVTRDLGLGEPDIECMVWIDDGEHRQFLQLRDKQTGELIGEEMEMKLEADDAP